MTTPTAPRPRRALAALAAGVLLVHVLLLRGIAPGPGPDRAGEAGPAMQVRTLPLIRPAAAAAVALSEATAPVRAQPRGPMPAAPGVPEMPAPTPAQALAADAPPASAAGGLSVPVYATRLPPAATLQYAVQGARSGLQAELRWQPDGEHYTLTLGHAAAGWSSVGALDLHGIAPERHVQTRRARELRAANFQRERGIISFSGPQVEFPLLPGAQDRLSWMLQLAGVLAADPALAESGREVALFVAGVRGDAAVWTFSVVGRERAELPEGTVEATLHLHREPQRPYDTRVDIWLDPARHHLPVRVRLATRTEGESTDFALVGMTLP